MKSGLFHGAGMLLYDDIVLYAGDWQKGNTASNTKEMRGSIDMHPGELLQLYLYKGDDIRASVVPDASNVGWYH